MSAASGKDRCDHLELVYTYALGALSAGEASEVQAHIAMCSECHRELERVRPVVDGFVAWPTDVLRPSAPLWDRLVDRIAARGEPKPAASASSRWASSEPEWEQVAPGISCMLLASDPQGDRVTMLVRLAPGVEYPPHTHAGTEELHLLAGELWIDDRKLYPGDYNRAERGTADKRVWSETGCTCVLITSPSDVLG
jgi:anti-sigma factor ChrR (cupin superfamily)